MIVLVPVAWAVSRYDVPPAVMRMNHYWGSRKRKWGKDTQERLDTTIKGAGFLFFPPGSLHSCGLGLHSSGGTSTRAIDVHQKILKCGFYLRFEV